MGRVQRRCGESTNLVGVQIAEVQDDLKLFRPAEYPVIRRTDFRSAYNLALRVVDNPDLLPDNPIKGVTFNKERASGRVILPEDLPDLWEKLQALPNPLRRAMHELGLLSGLRPGTLVALRRDWVELEQRAISIPRMKSGRAFDLPLSRHMVGVVKHALEIGSVHHPKSEWLFPTRSAKVARAVIATQVWREKSLPSETGHILRHTYRTVAQRIGIDQVTARLLLDHTVPGIDGVYIHERALFDRLLEAQEKMSAAMLAHRCWPTRRAARGRAGPRQLKTPPRRDVGDNRLFTTVRAHGHVGPTDWL